MTAPLSASVLHHTWNGGMYESKLRPTSAVVGSTSFEHPSA